MKKKVVFAVLIILIFPISTMAAEGGYFNGVTIKNNFGDPLTYPTDNDIRTGGNVRHSSGLPWYVFSEPEIIDKFYYYGTPQITLNFYSDSAKTQLIKKFQIQSVSGHSQSTWLDIPDIPNVRSITASTDGNGIDMILYELDFKTISQTIIDHDEITNLTATQTYDTVDLSWDLPKGNAEFTGSNLYRDNVLIASLDNTQKTYTDINLTPSTTYSYVVKTTYTDGFETTGVKKLVTTNTPIPIVKIKNLKHESTWDKVNVWWENPDSPYFTHVNIYRKNAPLEQTTLEETFIGTYVSAEEEYTKVFETNGTYWTDYTVQSDTTYEYKVTSENTDGLESEPEYFTETTPKEPTPYVKNLKGDVLEESYSISWGESNASQLRILINDQLYKQISVADGSILIPKEDMIFRPSGEPSVTVIPISESGLEGVIHRPFRQITFFNITFPIRMTDLIKACFDLLKILGPFILLVLSFEYAKPIANLLKRFATETKERNVKK